MFYTYRALFCLCWTIVPTTSHPNVDAKDIIPSTPIVNTTVTNWNGRDVSSSFQKRVFYYNTSENAGGGGHDAQMGVARILDSCDPIQGSFVESSCNYKPGVLGSIRSYTYQCKNYKKGVRNKKYGIMDVTTYNATCTDREICVNGRRRESQESKEPIITAFCIDMDAFVALNEPNLADVSGATLTTLLTSPDMETPLMEGRIDIETEAKILDGQGKDTPSKECVDCVSLTTEELPSTLTSLQLNMWMMEAGIAAVALAGLHLLAVLAV